MLKPLPKNLRAVLTATNDNYPDDWRYLCTCLYGHIQYSWKFFASGEILPTNFKTYSNEYFCNLKGSWAWRNYCPTKNFGYQVPPTFSMFLHSKTVFLCIIERLWGQGLCFIVYCPSFRALPSPTLPTPTRSDLTEIITAVQQRQGVAVIEEEQVSSTA